MIERIFHVEKNKARSPESTDTDQEDTYTHYNTLPSYFKACTTDIHASIQTTDLSVGISMGDWETVISRKPDCAGTANFDRYNRTRTVQFHRPETRRHATKGDTTKVSLQSIETCGRWNKRLVAVTNDGSEHAARIGNHSGGDSGMAVFERLSLSSIKEFRLQIRPYCWVKFENVSVQPGERTVVKVVSADEFEDIEK